jgi:hypothetical protein
MPLLDRVKNMLLKPKEEWLVIDNETNSGVPLIMSYLLPLTIVAALATFLGILIVGGSLLMEFGLITALILLVQLIVAVYVNAVVTDALAPSFSSQKNLNKSIQLVVYAATPSYVGAILNIIPSIGWLGMLAGGIYSIYLFYLGIPILKKTPEDKIPIYLIAIIVVLALVYWLLQMLLWRVCFPDYYAAHYMM